MEKEILFTEVGFLYCCSVLGLSVELFYNNSSVFFPGPISPDTFSASILSVYSSVQIVQAKSLLVE